MAHAHRETAHPTDKEQWERWHGKAGAPFRATPVYRLRLNGPTPGEMVISPKDFRPVNAKRGARIIRGNWLFDGVKLSVKPDRAPWGPSFKSAHFADRIHRFDWLRDLLALGPAGTAHARALVVSWVQAFGKWENFAWRTDVTARRLSNWFSAGPALIEPLDAGTRFRVLESIGRQIRHLSASGGDCLDPLGRAHIATALSLAGTCFPDAGKYADSGLAMLESENKVHILADGGHASRCPETLADALIDLHTVEDIRLRTSQTFPDELNDVQTKMARMLLFFSPPAGGLLVAHGGGDAKNGLAQAALGPQGDIGRSFTFTRLGGFHRIDSPPMTVFVDTGATPEPQFARTAHFGSLAIEIHDGPNPIVTSCGAHADSSPAWRASARLGAAHSVMVLDAIDPVTYRNDDTFGTRLPLGPQHLSVHRIEENEQFLLEGQHGGWAERFGLLYRRRLYVAKDGKKIVGDDALFRPVTAHTPPRRDGIPYILRFHLHPGVEAMPGPDAETVLLGMSASGNVWRFRCDAAIAIEPSIHAASGQRVATVQLVIAGIADPEGDGSTSPNRLRWILTRVTDKQ